MTAVKVIDRTYWYDDESDNSCDDWEWDESSVDDDGNDATSRITDEELRGKTTSHGRSVSWLLLKS